MTLKSIILKNENSVYYLISDEKYKKETLNLTEDVISENYLIKTDEEETAYYKKAEDNNKDIILNYCIYNEINIQNDNIEKTNELLKKILSIAYFFKYFAIIGIVIAIISVVIQFVH